jgi:hypothetical protein
MCLDSSTHDFRFYNILNVEILQKNKNTDTKNKLHQFLVFNYIAFES